MLRKPLALALVGAALLSAPALAQTKPQSTNRNSAAQTMNTGNWLTQEKSGQWRASKLDGLNVYNNNNETIGEIKELLLDNSGKVQAVVIGVGGFLGMGERDVAVPFDQLKFVNEPRAVATSDNRTVATPNAPATSAPADNRTAAPANPNARPADPNAPTTTGTVARTNTPDTTRRFDPDHALLNMTKDQLKAAPEFRYAR
jgi:sporulation protein YlmC with PRC-barrel domain